MKKIGLFLASLSIVSCNFNSTSNVELNLIPYTQGDKLGYFNSEGKIVINPQFSSGSTFHDGLALVRSTGDEPKWGFINEEGKFVINAVYKRATVFQDGIAFVVSDNGAPTAINKKGESLFVLKDAEEVNLMSEGLAAYVVKDKNENKWGFVDKNGKTVINPQFSFVKEFSDGKCAVKNEEGKWGYIDKDGKIVINYQFDLAYSFKNGKATVELDNKEGIIDEEGKYLINPQYSSIQQDGKKFIVNQDGKVGWSDKDGKFIINPQFDHAFYFHNQDLAAFESDDKYGYIDEEGKIVINPQFDFALPFVKGKALVKSSGKYGIINEEGKYEVNPQFENVSFDFLSAIIENNPKSTIFNSVKSDYLDVDKIVNSIDFNSPEKLTFEDTFKGILNKLNLKKGDFNSYSTQHKVISNKEINDNASYSFAILGNAKDYNYSNYDYYVTDNNPDGFLYDLKLKNKAAYKADNIYKAFKAKLSGYSVVKEGTISGDDVIVLDSKKQKIVLLKDGNSTVNIYILSKDFNLTEYLNKISGKTNDEYETTEVVEEVVEAVEEVQDSEAVEYYEYD